MPKNKSRNSKSSSSKRGKKIREGTKKLFEDLGTLASQEPPADHPSTTWRKFVPRLN